MSATAMPPEPRWDITDFGLGNFEHFGLVLINLAEEPEYCEKLMYARARKHSPHPCEERARVSHPGSFLQMARLAVGHLDRVRSGLDDDFHGPRHALDAGKEARLIEKSVVDGVIEAAAGCGIEEAVVAVR